MIVLAQLCGTSLWFSVNGVGLSLARDLGFTEADLGGLTLAVQAGFILGTLAIAASGLADRFRASRLFAASCLLGALINAGFVLAAEHATAGLLLRFATGLCLAGIYPLGMKLVIGWTPTHKGAALAWLVGMLTLGTALPHLLRGSTPGLPWAWPLLGASLLALAGARPSTGSATVRTCRPRPAPPGCGRAWRDFARRAFVPWRVATSGTAGSSTPCGC